MGLSSDFYTIRLSDNLTWVRKSDEQRTATAQEINMLITRLQYLADNLDKYGSQEAAIAALNINLLNNIKKWHIHDAQDFNGVLHHRTRHTKIGNCIYFLKHPCHADAVKIGYTENIQSRTRSLSNSLTREFLNRPYRNSEDYKYNRISVIPVILLAIAECEKHKELERYFHTAFHNHHSYGEWYNIELKDIEQYMKV